MKPVAYISALILLAEASTGQLSMVVPDGTYTFMDGGPPPAGSEVGTGKFSSPDLTVNPTAGSNEDWSYIDPPGAYVPGGNTSAHRSLCFMEIDPDEDEPGDEYYAYVYKWDGVPVPNANGWLSP